MKARLAQICRLLLVGLLLPAARSEAQIQGATNLAPALDLTAQGADLGGVSDQAAFSYQSRTGDFDVQVRVASVAPSDVWAKAGLMARASLTSNSAFVAALGSPSLAGCFFESRAGSGSGTSTTGNFPVNYPDTWLRLKRAGNLFSGYASLDGATWLPLGSTTLTLSNTLLVGVVATSHSTNQPTTAQFREFGDVTGGQITNSLALPEPLGPSSRRTGLVITEIMYKPAARADGKNLEFIELFNANPFFEDVSGYRIDGDVQFTFPQGTVLAGGSFLVVAAAPSDLQSVYGITNVVGPHVGHLTHSGKVRLLSRRGAVYLEVPYSNKAPWPVGADGTGHSLVLARPSYGEADPHAWAASAVIGGSPGAMDPAPTGPLRSVVINEFLAHWHQGVAGFIELYNHSNQAVDLSGCWLSDDPATNKFQIPAGTTIGPRGFVTFTKNALNFGLSAKGVTLYWLDPTATQILDAEPLEPETENVSIGRFPDGASEFYPLATPTPGGSNSAILTRDVVINEIMYAPISGDSDDEYVELYNQGANAVNLSGWAFVSGINFTFLTNAVIPAKGYLVVARNATNLMAHYPNLNATNTVGDFQGTLSGKGDRLALGMPEAIVTTDKNNNLVTNVVSVVVDEVTYGVGGRWGQWAHGGGSSLELIDPRANHRLAYNWADSDETRKSGWVTVQSAGVLDNGVGTANSLQVIMLGGGECLVDDVAVTNSSGSNVVVNGSFEGGLTNWFAQGDEVRSSLETNLGINGSQCLHVRASEEGDTGANRIRTRLALALATGTASATISARVRWLCGWPEILFRLNGNYLEATSNILTTQYFGTPGLPNSRAAPNTGPAIYEVTHSPVVPATIQPVVVTARVHDPDGIQSVVLNYRVDPSTNYVTVPMVDDGTGGDAVAGDGIYSATIPGQGMGVVVAFYVAATDRFVPPATSLFPNNPPMRECLVRFGDPTPTSSFGSYRLWLTQKTVTTWVRREVLSHEPLDGTFVYDNSRVVYNMTARYTGSPFHQEYTSPVGVPCSYTLTMPDDDQVLGTTSFNKQHAPGNTPNDDPTIQAEQTAYWIGRQIGLPWNYKRYVALFVNGNRRGPLMEDTQVPDGDVIKENFPNDTDGDLHKLYGWFEFADDGRTFNNVIAWATLQNFTTTGGIKKLARYRWNWRPRAVHGSANNFTNLFALVDAANTPTSGPYVQNLTGLADMDNWMRTFALNHSVGNWDSYGNRNGQNMYAYKPPHGNWTMFVWDFNIVLGNSGSDGPTGDDLFQTGDPTVSVMYNTPVFRRNYWRVLKEIANGPMLATNVNPVMDAKYAAFQGSGITVSAPTAVKSWIATRRTYILGKLNTVNTTFAITSNNGADFTSPTSTVPLRGSAPVEVADITVNGIPYPVTWTSVTNWLINVPLSGVTNALALQGYDDHGAALTNATASIRVTFTGQVERPQDHVRINEILYHPLVPDTEFVELYNSSAVTTFDLSRWRFPELGFTFPDGTLLLPQGYTVIAKDSAAFAAAYGTRIPVAGEFPELNPSGQTLTLIAPGRDGAADTVVNQVAYAHTAPWPEAADGTGASLQLIDPTQDNTRVANWTAVPTNRTDDRWRFVSVTGTASTSRLYIYLTSPGDVYVDDLCLAAGRRPGGGPNLLTNGGFESVLSGPWTVSPNLAQSGISTNVKHSGNASLHLIATSGGTTRTSAIWEDTATPLVTNAPYTLSYWFRPSTNGAGLVVRLSGSGIVSSNAIAPEALPALALATPGAPNSVRAPLPAFPTLWLNEVQPDNLSSLTNSAGARSPWIELFNPGTNALDLGACYLSDNTANTIQWAFPEGAQVAPGQFLIVWADGQAIAADTNELHTSFSLAPGTGTIALSQLRSNQPIILDFLDYTRLSPGRSYGAFPDGQGNHRQVFALPTPGAPNDTRFPPVNVTLNEWMANNNQTLVDPLTGNFEDWFELFNADTNAVDLTDYTLTDDPANPARFVVPPGTVIPPTGFLLVWADGGPSASPSVGDLHASFKLAKAGSFLGLFAPDGATVDALEFGPQTADVSEGRSPDGAPPPFQFMTTPTPGAPNVAPAPRFVGASLDAQGGVVFVWAAHTGKSYRVESTDDLSTGNWLDLATNVVSGATGSYRDSRGAQQGRFYRVLEE